MIDYKQLRAAVDAKLSTDPEFRTIMKRITEGRATFIDTARYSQVLSHILGSEVSKAILNVDDREAVVSHLLHDSYEDINDVFGRVQKNVDKSKGLDLKPQRGEYPGERVEQFVHSLVDPTVEDSVIKRRARAGTETITKSFHDDAIKANAEFHEEAGLKCYIERIGVDCCQWCSDVAGKYEMKDQPQGIFRRHDNCDCTVIYDGQVLRGQVGNNGRRSKKWVEVPKDAGAAEPVRLNKEQAQKLEQEKLKINKSSIDNLDESGIIKSGAISGALDYEGEDEDRAKIHAERYYNSVRKMTTDVHRIAENTGFPEELIQSIKDFVFNEKHDLGDKFDYFVPDYKMAQSWQRLIEGKHIQKHDLTLLHHEKMERELMKQGFSQDEAHSITSKKYNYAKEATEYYDKIKGNNKK